MTLQENALSQEPDAAQEGDPSYVIDPSKVDALNRSLAVLLASRRCADCRERLEAQGGNVPAEEHIRHIEECCSRQEGFIQPEMPMQEIVFRTMLAGGNKPAALSYLHNEVTDTWYTPMNPRSISVDNVRRVLEGDSYYGFAQAGSASS